MRNALMTRLRTEQKINLAYCKCTSNVGMSIKSQNNQTNATTKWWTHSHCWFVIILSLFSQPIYISLLPCILKEKSLLLGNLLLTRLFLFVNILYQKYVVCLSKSTYIIFSQRKWFCIKIPFCFSEYLQIYLFDSWWLKRH